MHRRDDETEQDRSKRLTRTCCWCGREDEDFPASDAHEMRCTHQPSPGRRTATPAAKENQP
ncbi:hypothetical protein [Actinoalloteichus sp. GBA129-24]|uniref:hypothetical protein n=1 Tax=Actinoalloteichus sp. GBA129-24 TaxID=1612551 RepID=UPI000951ECD0|nr:hypothetical protein [Actinoalloteichus sp. GBA129-24]